MRHVFKSERDASRYAINLLLKEVKRLSGPFMCDSRTYRVMAKALSILGMLAPTRKK